MFATEPEPTADQRTVLVSLSLQDDFDDEDIELATRQLLVELRGLDLDHVGPTGGSELPPGAKGTRLDSLLFTALSGQQINEAMESCTSQQKVLVLDCCYSGAFPAGHIAKADSQVHTLERFQGRGRVVLTASDATQYSFEGDRLVGSTAGSVFTRYLVQGLETGQADLDGDGNISLDELYSYVHDHVIEEMPQQRPKKQENTEGRIIVGRNINWALPVYVRNAIDSPIAKERLSALDMLSHLHRTGNDVVRTRVLEIVRQLCDDDSKAVSAAAVNAMTTLAPDLSRREAEERSRREAEERSRREAEERSRREAEEPSSQVEILQARMRRLAERCRRGIPSSA